MVRNKFTLWVLLLGVGLFLGCVEITKKARIYRVKSDISDQYKENTNSAIEKETMLSDLLLTTIVKKQANKNSHQIYLSDSTFIKGKLFNCRGKVKGDTVVIQLFLGGVMDVNYLTIKKFGKKFKLSLHYADDVSSYEYETLEQSLVLMSNNSYQINEEITGFLEYKGMTNFKSKDRNKNDYFAKLKGKFRCKLSAWNAFILRKKGVRWDNVF